MLVNNKHTVVARRQHNHPENPIDQEAQQFRRRLKAKAGETNEVPSKVMREVASTSNPIVQTRMSKTSQRKVIDRIRRKKAGLDLKKNPNPDEFDIPDILKNTLRGEQFLQKSVVNEEFKILIFATPANIKRLSEAVYWLMDGTFSTVPTEYRQLYSIHAPVGVEPNVKVVPLVYMLMSKKSQEMYTNALETLLDVANNLNVNLNPTYILIDFEKAAISSIRDIFPNCTPLGCYFHWTQNLIKKLGFLHLKASYANDVSIFMGIKKLQALTFLPPERVIPAFNELKLTLPAKLKVFITYFEETYLTGRNNNGRPMYPPAFWSNYISVLERLPRTTNILESWHSRWTTLVGTRHLGIIRIINEIRTEQHTTEGTILNILAGNVHKANEEKAFDKIIFEKVANVENWTDANFIEGVALNLSEKGNR